jgi:hypothetical protein
MSKRRKRGEWYWTSTREKVCVALALGFSPEEIEAKEVPEGLRVNITARSIYRWKNRPEFDQELDHLSLITGIAAKAERVRFYKKVIRQFIREDGKVLTEKDPLDWIKLVIAETDGLNLGIGAALAEVLTQVASGGQAGPGEET